MLSVERRPSRRSRPRWLAGLLAAATATGSLAAAAPEPVELAEAVASALAHSPRLAASAARVEAYSCSTLRRPMRVRPGDAGGSASAAGVS